MKAILAMLALVICNALIGQTTTPEQPNILFIVVDDLNDYVGFLENHPQAESPNIDRLVSRGTVFTNAYCNNPQCAPSRTSFLTGKDPEYTGVFQAGEYIKEVFRDNFDSLSNNETVFTLPEMMREGGYYTKQVHKVFHGRNFFNTQDIDFDTAAVAACDKSKSWNELTDLTGLTDPEPLSADHNGISSYEWGFYPDALESTDMDHLAVDSALSFLDDYRNGDARFCDKPFFLGLGFYHPHQPAFAAERYFPAYYNTDYYALPYALPYQTEVTGVAPVGLQMPTMNENPLADFDALSFMGKEIALRNGIEMFFQDWVDSLGTLPTIDPALTSAERRAALVRAHKANSIIAYMASVSYMDAQIGRMLDYLDLHPSVRDNTIIVLVSDHGFSLGEKQHWKKFALWENDIRIPMLIVDPAKTGGQRCEETVSLLDVFPTMLDLAGIAEPAFPDGSRYLDGKSLVPFLKQPTLSWNRPVLTSVRVNGANVTNKCYPSYSVRDDRWHYIRYRTNGASSGCDFDSSMLQEELYDIGINRETDPNEWYNLAGDSTYQDVIDYLSQWLPDGNFFNEEAGYASISNSGILPCAVDLNSTYFLQANLFAADGSAIELAAGGYAIEWKAVGFSSTVSDVELMLNASLFDSLPSDELRLFLKITDPAGTIYQDMLRMNLTSISHADLAFDLQINAAGQVEVSNFDLPDANYNSILWTFGDGNSSQRLQPYPHQYAAPGLYSVTNEVIYGNAGDATGSTAGPVCSLSTVESILLDSSLFDAAECLVSQSIFLEDFSTEHANLYWPNVFGADHYQLRFARNTGDTELNWVVKNVPATVDKILGLKSNTEYLVQVQSSCPAATEDSSTWSAPLSFCTLPCAPPINLSVDSAGGASIDLNWENAHTGDYGYEVTYYPINQPRNRKAASTFNPNSIRISGLKSYELYEFKVKSLCAGDFGFYTVKSSDSERVRFKTTRPTGLATSDPSQLLIMPNPAKEFTTVVLDQKLMNDGGELLIELFNGNGQLVFSQSYPSGQPIRIPTHSLAGGFYQLLLSTAEISRRGKLMVVR